MRRHMGALPLIVAVAMAAALATGAAAGGAAVRHRSSAPKGTVVFAETPGSPPTYIFPMEPAIQETEANFDVAPLLYRPLYWYGNNQDPSIDYSYSIANPPKWSNDGRTVTITLKHWKWSDGETVTSRDVEFWMNLLKASIPQGSWGFYAPGYFPDMITKQSYPNASTIVFTLNKSYNEKWFLYSELSQITPLPMAWDRTAVSQPAPSATAPALPDTTPTGALAVWKFLNTQSLNISDWATSPIWKIVDGPFRLSGATSTGKVTFHPNPDYSGQPKAQIATFIEEPFTSDQSEFNVIRSQGSSKVQFGYLPPEYAPQASKVESQGYRNVVEYDFSYSFILINFNNPQLGPAFRQLYVRQALQHLVDQTGWIHAFLHGDAVATHGPEPLQPKNSYVDAFEKQDRYPFSISSAKRLFTSHGWVDKDGVDVCERPGTGSAECGNGIKRGQKLQMTLVYASGMASLGEEMTNFAADAAKAGVKVTLQEHPLNTVFGMAAPCQSTQKACSWQAIDYGSGVQYAVGYYPSGEQLLLTGAGFNLDNYSSPTMDNLIKATTDDPASQSQQTLNAYQNYAASNLPYVYVPTSSGNPYANTTTLVSKCLAGVTFNVFTEITPETWHLTC